MLALEFNGLRGRKRQRVDGRAQDVAAGVLVELAAVLDQFDKLRLVVERIQQKNTARIGQAQAGDNERRFTFVRFVGLGNLLDGFIALTRAFAVVFICGGPVHHLLGHFLPVIALGAVIADTLAHNLPFGYGLVGTVFEDETLGILLRSRTEGKRENQQKTQIFEIPQHNQISNSASSI